jgi:hypothetical protein
MTHSQLQSLVELTAQGYRIVGVATPLGDGRVTLVLRSPIGTQVVARPNGHVAPAPPELLAYIGRPGRGGRGRRKVLPDEDVRLWVDGCLTTPELMCDNSMTRVTALRALRRQLGLAAYVEARQARQDALSPAETPLPPEVVRAYEKGASLADLAERVGRSVTYVKNRLPPDLKRSHSEAMTACWRLGRRRRHRRTWSDLPQ